MQAALGEHSFGWPATEDGSLGSPHTLLKKPYSAFLSVLEEFPGQIDNETLFLLYYFGHGVVHQGQLHMAFGDNKDGKAMKKPLTSILDDLHSLGVRKLALIADLCHAGAARQAFQVQRSDLTYCVLAAAQRGYTYQGKRGGRWTSALSEALEPWNRHQIVDRGLGQGTFHKWFSSAEQIARNNDANAAPHWIDGGLGDHVLFPEHRELRSPVLGSRMDRTIYNRLYLLLRMLVERPQTPASLLQKMLQERPRVFLIASGAGSEDDRYISTDAIDRYLQHASAWRLIDGDGGASSKSRRYTLTKRGQKALSDGGNRYNEILNNSIYEYLADYHIDRDFLDGTMREIIKSFNPPDVNAFLRQIDYKLEIRSLDRTALEFALRMLSQSGDFQKNTGNVFFPP